MLTEAKIRHMAGPLEDWQVSAIIRTGAKESELEEALVWLEEQGDLTAERAQGLSAAARELVDILSADAPPSPDER